MKKALIISSYLAVCQGFISCSDADSSLSKLNISGGKVADANTPTIVSTGVISLATNAEFYKSTTNASSPYCSGVVLSQHLILTAAHCTEFLDRQVTSVIFANSATAARKDPAQRVRLVNKFEVHPGYPLETHHEGGVDIVRSPYAEAPEKWMAEHPGVPPNDLAIIRFTGELPTGYTPVAFADTAQQNPAKVLLAGFGITNSFKIFDSGVLRFVEDIPVQPVDEDTQKRLFLPVAETMDVTHIMTGERPKGACPGDSGGPAFAHSNTGYELMGILSLGESARAAPDSGLIFCLGHAKNGSAITGNIYTDVRAYQSWIAEVKSRLDP